MIQRVHSSWDLFYMILQVLCWVFWHLVFLNLLHIGKTLARNRFKDMTQYCMISGKVICFIDHAKAFDCVDHHKLENSSRDRNTRPPDLPLEKSVCRSGSKSECRSSQNWTWNNRLVPNRKRSTSRLYIVTLLI